MAVVWIAWVVLMAGVNLPTPLYAVYSQRFGFSSAVLTAVFTGNGGQLTPTGYVDAAQPAVVVGAAVVAVSAIVAAFLPAGRSAHVLETVTDDGLEAQLAAASPAPVA